MKNVDFKLYFFTILMGILIIPIFLVYNTKMVHNLDIEKIKNSILSFYDIEKIEEDKSLGEFTKNFNISNDNIEECIYYYPVDSMLVEEFFILKYNNKVNKNELLNNIKNYVDKKKNAFISYGVDQYEIIKNFMIYDKNPYIVYVVNKNINNLNKLINEVSK